MNAQTYRFGRYARDLAMSPYRTSPPSSRPEDPSRRVADHANFRVAATLGLAALLLSACGSRPAATDLTGASTERRLDVAPRVEPATMLPVIVGRSSPLEVAVNVQEEDIDGAILVWLRLELRHLGGPMLNGPLSVRAVDGSGRELPALSRDAVLAAALGSPSGPTTGEHVAGAAGMAGSVAGLAGAPVPGLALLGPATALMAPRRDPNAANLRARWALLHWMPDTITLETGRSRAGVLAFVTKPTQPLTIEVTVGDRTISILTR